MKTFHIISAALIFTCCMDSCVSSRKYNDSLSARAELQTRYNVLETDFHKLEKDKSSPVVSEEERLIKEEASLKDREKKMQELGELVDAERMVIRDLKKEVCSALKCFTPDELSVDVREGKLYVSLSDKLLFPSGSDEVNKRGKEAISALAMVMINSQLEILVEGDTDNVPIKTVKNKDNWDLSVHRATSVTRLLTESGINPKRVIACGRGEYYPVSSNATEQGRRQNRRTEIVLAPKLDKLWQLTEEEDLATASTASGLK